MVGGMEGSITPVVSLEVERTIYRMTFWDNSISFVAKPVKVKTRAGKDYFVLRVTIPKDVSTRLQVGAEDYLLVRAKVAQWYHMLDWASMPEAWERLPPEFKALLAQSGLAAPAAKGELAKPTSLAGSQTASGSALDYLPATPASSA
jgi:hypothetical protein